MLLPILLLLASKVGALALRPNLLLVDHLNINHEQHRHDLVKAFYFELLGCAADARKLENLEKGTGTVWANCGITQFHLSEGKADAQVLDGCVTLGYPSLAAVRRPPPPPGWGPWRTENGRMRPEALGLAISPGTLRATRVEDLFANGQKYFWGGLGT